ncbi:MAG: hypothetical protein L6V88_06930 [Anaerotruncus sp.]|nr:MAG: hypothetical protein L6V88_06930 [Anaerotruncus sp.]
MLSDKIIVMENGTVAESGTHAELTAAGGEYAKKCLLCKRQATKKGGGIMEKKQNQAYQRAQTYFYFYKTAFFKISPLLVIGDALSGIFTALPTRLIAVIGAKYVADTVESGSNARQILYAVIAIAAILIASTTATCLFREFYWNIAREKANAGLSKNIFTTKQNHLTLLHTTTHIFTTISFSPLNPQRAI